MEENKIGISIENLADLEAVLGRITEEQYADMKENIRKMAEAVRTGEFMRRAIEKAEQIQSQG